MFFWFFPAEESPETAPVVIWLQGGPGGSSMFGALKLHGPIITTVSSIEKSSCPIFCFDVGGREQPTEWGWEKSLLMGQKAQHALHWQPRWSWLGPILFFIIPIPLLQASPSATRCLKHRWKWRTTFMSSSSSGTHSSPCTRQVKPNFFLCIDQLYPTRATPSIPLESPMRANLCPHWPGTSMIGTRRTTTRSSEEGLLS